MSHPGQNTSLSLSARLFCYLGPPSTILLTYFVSPQTALLSPAAFLPTAWFYGKWRDANKINPLRRGELEPMIWTYASAGTLGLAAVGAVQMAIVKAGSAVLFGADSAMKDDFWTEFARSTINGLTADQLKRRTELASSWQNWVFIAGLSFVAAGFCEETLKYLPIAYARRRGTAEQRKPRDRAYIDYAIAGALSFGLIETIGFLNAACKPGHETGPKLALTIFERVVGQFCHLSVAALTALRAIRRDYYGDPLSWWSVVGPAAILHGAGDFIALGASALEGNVGWIHPTGLRISTAMFGLYTGLVATAVWQVRREWKALVNRDRISGTSKDDSAQK
jgi:hypothetical protein